MSELKKTAEGVYEVHAILNGEEWKECRTKAIEVLAKKINIKGFRKGKAPLNIVQSKINPNDLINEMTHQGLNIVYRQILAEHQIRPYTQPTVDVTGISDDELACTFTITTAPEVTLGKYKGIEIPLDDYQVTDADVEEAINKLLSDNAELVLKETPAEIGDTVVLDFKGYMNGKEFEGGSAQNYSLVLGSNQFIPGFEDQLVGATPESKVDVNVTFPEQYIKELAGKDAKFVCLVHEIKTKQTPTLDDEFVKSLSIGGVETVEELKEYERKTILGRKEQKAKEAHLNKVVQEIVNGSTFSIADAVVDGEVAQAKANLYKQLEENGLTYEQYKELTGSTDEKIDEVFKQQGIVNLKTSLVLDKIAQVENLIISQEELNKQYEQLAASYGTDVDTIKRMYGPTPRATNQFAQNMLSSKIQRFIILNNQPAAATTKAKKATKKAAKEEGEAKETKTKTTKKTTSRKKKVEEGETAAE